MIKCVKAGGHTLTAYGQYSFDEGEELDLLDAAVPETLRAGSWSIAQSMCEDPAAEIAELITAGHFEVVSSKPPYRRAG